MLILYREKTIDIQKIAHDHSTTSYGADKPKIVQYNTIFTTLLWFLDSIWALLDQKSRVFSVPMYEVVRCFMFRVVRWKASCWTHLSWNFWNCYCLWSTFTRTVSIEKSDFSILVPSQQFDHRPPARLTPFSLQTGRANVLSKQLKFQKFQERCA